MALSKKLEMLTKKMQKDYDVHMVDVAANTSGRIIPTHSTGSLLLDMVCGTGPRAGFPEGRIIEIYGPESSGKTTTALLAIAARQREEDQKEMMTPGYSKKYCLYVDAEHALDLRIAEEYGVNLEELIVINPTTSEDAMDVLDTYIRTGDIGIVVVDSVPALLPSSVEKASYNQQFMAILARFMSVLMQKITGPTYQTGTTLIFINQIREKPGAYSPTGVAETTPGGRALKFSSSIRLSVRAGERIKEGDQVIGHKIKIKNIKNKIDMPYKEAELTLIYGHGIDRVAEVFQVALKAGIIKQGGAWFSYVDEETGEIAEFGGEQMKFQGREKCIDALRRHPMFYGELEDLIRGVEVEADSMTEEEIQAMKKAERDAEEENLQIAEKIAKKQKKEGLPDAE